MHLAWPDNLVTAVFCSSDTGYKESDFETTIDYVAEHALNEKEHTVLISRFKGYKPLTVIGKEMNITKERVRQIQTKMLAKLRAPIWNRYLLYGIEYCQHMDAEAIELKEKTDLQFKEIIKSEFPALIGKQNTDACLALFHQFGSLDIGSLGLSTRGYTVLARNRYNGKKLTTVDAVCALSREELQGLAFCGDKTANSIEAALNAHGFELTEKESAIKTCKKERLYAILRNAIMVYVDELEAQGTSEAETHSELLREFDMTEAEYMEIIKR